MSEEGGSKSLGAGASYVALCNALLSGFGAVTAGFGLLVAMTFIASAGLPSTGKHNDWLWLAFMAVAFAGSVMNGVWSIKVAKHPTRHGLMKILVTTASALIVFAWWKAATA